MMAICGSIQKIMNNLTRDSEAIKRAQSLLLDRFQSEFDGFVEIIKRELWETLIENIRNNSISENIKFIDNISIEFNIEKKNILKNFLNFIIRNKKEYVNMELLNFIENILHISDINIDYMLPYTIIKLNKMFKQN